MKRLRFSNPGGLRGRFVTVRLSQDEELPRIAGGDKLVLEDSSGTIQGLATAVDAWTGDLAQVPAAILEMHQDPLGRTYSGLVLALRMDNPSAEVLPSTPVIALIMDERRGRLLR